MQSSAPGVPDSLDQEIARNQRFHHPNKLAENYLAKAEQAASQRMKAAYLKKALVIQKQLKHPEQVQGLREKLAVCYTYLEESDNALVEHFELLKTYQKQGDSLRIAQTHSAIASLLDNRHDLKNAYHHYLQALNMARALHSERGEAAILNNIAGLYQRSDSLSKAFESVHQAILLNEKSDNQYWLSINYMTLADIFDKLQIYDSIRYYLRKSEKALGQEGTTNDSIAYARKWGIYFFHVGNTEAALAQFNRGILMSRRIGSLYAEANFVDWLSEVYNSTGNPDKAMAYLEMHYTLMDSLRKIQDTETREELQIIYQTSQVQDSLKTALLQNDLIQKEVQRKKAQLTGILIASILLLILLIYGFFQYRKKLNTNRLLLRLQLKPEKNKTKYSQSSLSDETRKKVIDQLTDLMQNEQLFRDQDLNLTQLSERLGVSRTYISQVINETYGQTLINYVNDYRINLAKNYLADRNYDKYAISGIAEMVGFRSLSSFNTCFKKVTGLTPSYYRTNS